MHARLCSFQSFLYFASTNFDINIKWKNMVQISLKLKRTGPKSVGSTLNCCMCVCMCVCVQKLSQKGCKHRHMDLLTRSHTKFVHCLISHLTNGYLFFFVMAYSWLLLLLLIKVWNKMCLLINVWSQSWVRAL